MATERIGARRFQYRTPRQRGQRQTVAKSLRPQPSRASASSGSIGHPQHAGVSPLTERLAGAPGSGFGPLPLWPGIARTAICAVCIEVLALLRSALRRPPAQYEPGTLIAQSPHGRPGNPAMAVNRARDAGVWRRRHNGQTATGLSACHRTLRRPKQRLGHRSVPGPSRNRRAQSSRRWGRSAGTEVW